MTAVIEITICEGCDDPDCETCCDREMREYLATESPSDEVTEHQEGCQCCSCMDDDTWLETVIPSDEVTECDYDISQGALDCNCPKCSPPSDQVTE